jgi:hypothetical protein
VGEREAVFRMLRRRFDATDDFLEEQLEANGRTDGILRVNVES